MTLYKVPADFTGPITAGGSGRYGHDDGARDRTGRLTFTGAVNDRISVSVSAGPSGTVNLRKPDDSSLASQSIGVLASFIDTTTLPVAGSYSLFADFAQASDRERDADASTRSLPM